MVLHQPDGRAHGEVRLPDVPRWGLGVRAVTHEVRFAQDVADQNLFLDDGVVAERGGPEVLADPKEERTRRFLARMLDAG